MTIDSVWTAWLLRIQLLLIIVLIATIVGHKFSILPFRIAFSGFGLSLLIIFVCGLIGLMAILLGLFLHHGEWVKPALFALVVGLLPLVVIVGVVGPKNLSVPQIHDISTDLENPPVFNAAKKVRLASDNSLARSGEDLAVAQRKAYPDVQPLIANLDSSTALQRCLSVVNEMGWKIHDVDQSAGIIEAYAETKFFGFKDDIVIRVKQEPAGSRIDLRSVSRVGKSDLGANAKRIKQFIEKFKQGN